MATIRIPIMGAMTVPDSTGECFMQPIGTGITTIGTFPGGNLVMTFVDPSADTGFYGSFLVPKNYLDTANIIVVGVLDGTVGATSLDFEYSYISKADNEAIDAAFTENATANTGNTSGWTNEDMLELSISVTDGNFAIDDTVMYYLKRDQGTDDFVGDFHVTGLYFEYNDA
ncbi:hypothetical protein LCGC14_2322080 [marine sediment metagenome]|uniref:Uncharacterized protein n=1 Tax=marine sediment metagenome TaxID=412755 RepID=A0A0F9EV06_9ZZZZ|nr:hypothetical protein [Candidatus Scalindua sp.]